MNNNDERDYAEEACNQRILDTGDGEFVLMCVRCDMPDSSHHGKAADHEFIPNSREKHTIELDLTIRQYTHLLESLESDMDAGGSDEAVEAYRQVAKGIADKLGWELAPRIGDEDEDGWAEEQQAEYDQRWPSLPDLPDP